MDGLSWPKSAARSLRRQSEPEQAGLGERMVRNDVVALNLRRSVAIAVVHVCHLSYAIPADFARSSPHHDEPPAAQPVRTRELS